MDSLYDRRSLLKAMGACALCAGLGLPIAGCNKADAAVAGHPAKFWEAGEKGRVTCRLCPIGCTTNPGETGHCRARKNEKGKYVSLTYGRPAAMHNDPIEKKPLNHYLPGTKAFSIGLTGCNLRCRHCQNWQISQAEADQLVTSDVQPQQLIALAKKAGSQSVAYTYNEPTTFTEYIIDSSALARKAGLGAVVISNGYINEGPQRELVKNLTAYKVDLKGFSESFYRDICQAELKYVQESLVRLKKWGVWLEIVNLMIPTLNDDEKELTAMAKWIAANLGPDVPIHFTRFHPMYKIRNLPPTPIAALEKAQAIATAEGIHYAYVGNVPGHDKEHTRCHKCGNLLIRRYGFDVEIKGLKGGSCDKCGTKIPGVWEIPS